MKIKKSRKSRRRHGHQTAFRGAKERTRHSGNRGGYGKAGTGKRADHKKTLVINQTGGNNYFGKSRAIRRKQAPKMKPINLSFIQDNISSLVKSGKAKETKGSYEIILNKYKLLGEGELKFKANISVSSASASAIEKVKKSGGEVIILNNSSEEKGE